MVVIVKKPNKYLALIALGAAGGSIYILPYFKYVFYEQQMQVMNINNTQSGLLLTVYAIAAIILLFPGGIIADMFSSKKLIIGSLLLTTVLAVVYALTFNFTAALIIWILLAISCAFTFWAALIKAIESVGKSEEQGKMYGIYYASNGIIAAIINSIALYVSTLTSNLRQGLFYAAMVVAAGTFIAAILVFIFFRDSAEIKKKDVEKQEKFKFKDLRLVLKNPHVWLLGIIIFVSYSIYASTSYFTPYLTDVLGITPENSGVIAIIRTYIFMLLAPVGGLLCDKIFKSSSKYFMAVFTIVGVLLIGVLFIPNTASPLFVSIYTLLPAAFTMAQYGVAWSILRELDIPLAVTGTAIGVSSCISWTPDLFMHAMFGSWLDKFGNGGYSYIFAYLAVLAILGVVCSYIVRRHTVKTTIVSNQKIEI